MIGSREVKDREILNRGHSLHIPGLKRTTGCKCRGGRSRSSSIRWWRSRMLCHWGCGWWRRRSHWEDVHWLFLVSQTKHSSDLSWLWCCWCLDLLDWFFHHLDQGLNWTWHELSTPCISGLPPAEADGISHLSCKHLCFSRGKVERCMFQKTAKLWLCGRLSDFEQGFEQAKVGFSELLCIQVFPTQSLNGLAMGEQQLLDLAICHILLLWGHCL